ncbi:hypothetical protein HGI30_19770 [Paenibacillus albicereus]|uniref:Tyrosine protein kinase n=1 Tax=Paenibacillus albicereus TaxID=2726185 RepID=A0A6H2H1I5_9BACL|nr:hypothetical protein [Paenibacillus albicereus]QJC53551.1 hypothetical protein HGI30_19770 [Paenibacillus albicereus]
MNPNYPSYYPPAPQRNTPAGAAQGSIFPGLGEGFPYNHLPAQSLFAPPPSLMPPSPAPSIGPLATLEGAALPAAAAAAEEKKSSLFSLDKLTELKGFVDRIGGLDGILGTMTKAQKIIGSVQQMAPLVKVMMGSFSSSKKKSDNSKMVDLEDDDWSPPKKKRTKKKKRRTGGGGYAKGGRSRRRRTGTKRRPGAKRRRPAQDE